jgi:exodeoxyribonuclease-3
MSEAGAKEPAVPADVLKIISVNANSLRRAWHKGLKAYLGGSAPDVFCCQSTAVSSASPNTFHLPGYHGYFYYPTSDEPLLGTAVYTKIQPISARTGFDDPDARVIVLEFKQFFLVSVHFPAAGDQLENLRAKIQDFGAKFADLVRGLGKPAIIAGDFNVAHRDLDIYDPAEKEAAPGFTAEERGWFDSFLSEGFVDVFRDRHPDLQEFSYFERRFGRKGRSHGWRSDYFLASRAIEGSMADSLIEASQVFSDHVPIVLIADRAIAADDPAVGETLITVLNTDETIEPAPPSLEAEKPKRAPKKIDEMDMEVILAERRTTGRDRKPIIRKDFEEGDEKPAKKAKVNFDEEEYGKPPRKKKTKKSKPK